jgi:hypothetical protein
MVISVGSWGWKSYIEFGRSIEGKESGLILLAFSLLTKAGPTFTK